MGLFTKKPYNRTNVMARANEARSKGRRKKAIGLYREVLEQDPEDADALTRLAPLLAESGDEDGAWRAFMAAAAAHEAKGFRDRAAGIWKQVTEALPNRREGWEALAELNLTRERQRDAVVVLVEGSKNFTKGEDREIAVDLLSRAQEIEPWHWSVCWPLGRLLIQVDRVNHARQLFGAFVTHVTGSKARKVRWQLFRLDPGFGSFIRWVKALFGA